ncbi:MAG: hypothetical protein IPJ41_04140 [Phycisphaerales bacterium]|nr:hypothetical protein [Phycisphaerales bacterium]
MSRAVCFIERAERGVLPRRVRLITGRSEETWSFPRIPGDDTGALERGLREAAAWVSERLKVQGRAELAAVVLDSDGALCSWLTTTSTDPAAVDAMLRHAGEPGEDEATHAMGSPPHLSLSEDVRVPGGATIQPLLSPGGEGAVRARLGVMAVPDASVRLLLDELDSQGVGVGRVVTIWHAMSEAFDGEGSLGHAERVVAESASTVAQVLVDPSSGRLVWSWSRGGAPLCAGSFRVEKTGESEVRIARRDIARLATDWIAWSTQLGASPSRLRLVAPPGAWADESGMGEAVSGAWPGATADITFDEDPVSLALARFAERESDAPAEAKPSLEQLGMRPGRQHRAMYWWAAAAIVLASLGMGVAAWKVQSSASAIRRDAAKARSDWRKQAEQLLPAVATGPAASRSFDGKAIADLRESIDKRRQSLTPIKATPEKPVLQELETLAFVLGNPDYDVQKIDLSSAAVVIDLYVPDTAAYEELVASLGSIAGSSVSTWDKSPRSENRNGRPAIKVSLIGYWAQRPAQPRGAA